MRYVVECGDGLCSMMFWGWSVRYLRVREGVWRGIEVRVFGCVCSGGAGSFRIVGMQRVRGEGCVVSVWSLEGWRGCMMWSCEEG